MRKEGGKRGSKGREEWRKVNGGRKEGEDRVWKTTREDEIKVGRKREKSPQKGGGKGKPDICNKEKWSKIRRKEKLGERRRLFYLGRNVRRRCKVWCKCASKESKQRRNITKEKHKKI